MLDLVVHSPSPFAGRHTEKKAREQAWQVEKKKKKKEKKGGETHIYKKQQNSARDRWVCGVRFDKRLKRRR